MHQESCPSPPCLPPWFSYNGTVCSSASSPLQTRTVRNTHRSAFLALDFSSPFQQQDYENHSQGLSIAISLWAKLLHSAFVNDWFLSDTEGIKVPGKKIVPDNSASVVSINSREDVDPHCLPCFFVCLFVFLRR